MKTVKAYGKVIEFGDDVPDKEIKRVVSKLDPDRAIKSHKADFDGIKQELRQCTDESTKALLKAQDATCERICKAIEASKPDKVESFDATRTAEGQYTVVLNY